MQHHDIGHAEVGGNLIKEATCCLQTPGGGANPHHRQAARSFHRLAWSVAAVGGSFFGWHVARFTRLLLLLERLLLFARALAGNQPLTANEAVLLSPGVSRRWRSRFLKF